MRRRLLYHKTSGGGGGGGDQPTVSYSTPSISLRYATANYNDTYLDPEFSYSQTETIVYSDHTETNTITSGGSVTFTISNAVSGVSINATSGRLTFNENDAEDQLLLCTVSVQVVLNGQTGTQTTTVRQNGVEISSNLDMDVLFFNKNTHEYSVCDHTKYSVSDWNPSIYIPLGVVVIPESHNRYSGKYAGVVALNDAKTIQSVPSSTSVIWGDRNTNDYDDGIYNINVYPEDNAIGFITYNGAEGTVYDSFTGRYERTSVFYNYPTVGIPSDIYIDDDGWDNQFDTKTKYSANLWGAMDGEYKQGPSPYLYNNSQDTYSSLYGGNYTETTIYDNFCGEEINFSYLHRMTDIAFFYKSWIEDDEISNIPEMMPAMEACWRYAPEGSSEGCWYMPTSAEFGYVIARADAINNTIDQLNSIYGTSGTSIDLNDPNNVYLTSILATNSSSYYQYAIAHKDHGFTGYEVEFSALCRPFKKIYTNGVTNGVIGYENIPIYQDDDSYYSHWGIYRHDDADNTSIWPSGYISGTVYGVKIKDYNDWTIVRDYVPLLTFNNVGVTCYYDDHDAIQFGDYDKNAEPGWYLVRHIELSNGAIVRNINQNLAIDADWTGTIINQNSWVGAISTCYKYYDMRNTGNGTGLGLDQYDYAVNNQLNPFRIGFWNYDTAFIFHSTIYTKKDYLPWKYCLNTNHTDWFQRINYRDSIVEYDIPFVWSEVSMYLNESYFTEHDNPKLHIDLRNTIEGESASIIAIGEDRTDSKGTSQLCTELRIEYDDGTIETIDSFEVYSTNNSGARTYFTDAANYNLYSFDTKRYNTIATIKLVITKILIAAADTSSFYHSYPRIQISDITLRVTAS